MSGSVIGLVLLVAFSFAAGVGITAVGPGGVLATVGLVLFTDLSPAAVAGTAIVTHVATGVAGSAAYLRSGQLRESATRRTAVVLSVAALVGTPLGVMVNLVVPGQVFGILLAVFLLVVAALVWARGRGDVTDEAHHPRHDLALLVGGGLLVAVASGMFGVGGPLLTVPLLVAVGTPILPALAAAQVQSVVIAGVGTVGYLTQGAIDWPLAVLVGIPELCGVLIGWRIAHAVPAVALKRVLIVALVVLAPVLVLHGSL